MARTNTGSTSNYLKATGNTYNLPTNWTCCVRFKTSSDAAIQALCGNYLSGTGGFYVDRSSTNDSYRIGLVDAGFTAIETPLNSAPADGDWDHLIITKATNAFELFLNSSTASGSGTKAYSAVASYDLFVGCRNAGGSPNNPINGSMAQLAFYSRVLNSTEIGQFMAGTAPDAISTTNLDHYWPLDNSAAGNESDSGGTAWTLTEVGAMGYEAATFGSTTQILLPSADVTTTGWTSSAGGALYAAIDEATYSDTDYIYTGTLDAECEIQLQAGNTPGAGSKNLNVRVPAGFTPTGGWSVSLYQGSTLVQAFTSPAPAANTTATFSVTNAITDYSDLRVRIKSTA